MENTMGNRIKTARKKAKLTQQMLSDKVFISESYMAMIETDKRNPSIDVVTRIAEVLGISADYLLFGQLPQNQMTLFNEWEKLMDGRSVDEISSAQNVVKAFFEN